MQRRLALLVLALPLALACACTGSSSGEPGVTGKSVIEIEDLRRGNKWVLTPREGYGYRIEDGAGTKLGGLKVQSDRVKVKDASDKPRGKVKLKKDGFKLVDANDNLVLRGKDKGDKVKIKGPDDSERARFKGGKLEVGGVKLKAKAKDGALIVERDDGTQLVRVSGDVPAHAAAFLGWSDLDEYQQLALMVFLREVY
jgi:hypothetical protein